MRVKIGTEEYRIGFSYEAWERRCLASCCEHRVVHLTAGGDEIERKLNCDDVPREVYFALIRRPRLLRPVRAVTCEIRRGDEVIAKGTSYCSPEDEFVKERGRKLALTRALASCGPVTVPGIHVDAPVFTREQREHFWNAYLYRANCVDGRTGAIEGRHL